MAKYKISQANKTANTTASAIVANQVLVNELVIKNLSSQAVYIGDSGVTSSNGFQLAQGDTLSLGEHHSWELNLADIFVVTAANTADVRVSYVKRN